MLAGAPEDSQQESDHASASPLAASPPTPPRVTAQSTCSNGDERPPVGRSACANTNRLPSELPDVPHQHTESSALSPAHLHPPTTPGDEEGASA